MDKMIRVVFTVIFISIICFAIFIVHYVAQEREYQRGMRRITIGTEMYSNMKVIDTFSQKDKTFDGFCDLLEYHRFKKIPFAQDGNMRLFQLESEYGGKYIILVLVKISPINEIASFVVAVDGVADKKMFYMNREKIVRMDDDWYETQSIKSNGQPFEIMKKWLNQDEPHCAVFKLDKDI